MIDLRLSAKDGDLDPEFLIAKKILEKLMRLCIQFEKTNDISKLKLSIENIINSSNLELEKVSLTQRLMIESYCAQFTEILSQI